MRLRLSAKLDNAAFWPNAIRCLTCGGRSPTDLANGEHYVCEKCGDEWPADASTLDSDTVATLLVAAAKQIHEGMLAGTLRDSNGNSVGRWSVR